MPGKVDVCRCGAPRQDQAPASNDAAAPPRRATPTFSAPPAPKPGLTPLGFAVRAVIAIAAFGGLSTFWYMRTKGAADQQRAAMAQTAAAVSRRVRPQTLV